MMNRGIRYLATLRMPAKKPKRARKIKCADETKRMHAPLVESAIETLRQLEDVISGLEAQADNAGIDLEEARHWWKKAQAALASLAAAQPQPKRKT